MNHTNRNMTNNIQQRIISVKLQNSYFKSLFKKNDTQTRGVALIVDLFFGEKDTFALNF